MESWERSKEKQSYTHIISKNASFTFTWAFQRINEGQDVSTCLGIGLYHTAFLGHSPPELLPSIEAHGLLVRGAWLSPYSSPWEAAVDKPSMLKDRHMHKSIPELVRRVVVSVKMPWRDDPRVVSLALVPEQTVHQWHGQDLLHHGDQRSGWSRLLLPGLCAGLGAVWLILRALPGGTLHREGDQPVQGVSGQHLPVHPPGLRQGGLHPMRAWQQEHQGTETKCLWTMGRQGLVGYKHSKGQF